MCRIAVGVLLICLIPLLCGCVPAPDPVVSDPDPMVKIPAMKVAVDRHNTAPAGDMVRDLASDDAAVRFFAIGALQRLAGDDFGYHYYDDEPVRKTAILRWQAWLSQQKQVTPK